MTNEFTQPNILQDGLRRLSSDSLEGKKFRETLGRYGKSLLIRPNVFREERTQISKSKIGSQYLARNRYVAGVVVAMEGRLGKTFNSADAAQYIPVASTVTALAKEYGFASTDPNFNLLTFVECCLDEMGVKEADPALTDKSVRLTDVIDPNIETLDPAKNPDLLNKLKKELAQAPSWWNVKSPFSYELKLISQNDHAIRDFIQTRSRIRAMTIRELEERYRYGTLSQSELKQAGQMAQKIVQLASKCGVDSGKADSYAGLLVEEALEIAGRGDYEHILPDATQRIRLKKNKESTAIWIGNHRLRIIKRKTPSGDKLYLVNPQKDSREFRYMLELQGGHEYILGHRKNEVDEKEYRWLEVMDGLKSISMSDPKTVDEGDVWFYGLIPEHCTLKMEKDGSMSITNLGDIPYQPNKVHWNQADFDEIRPAGYLRHHPPPSPDKLLPHGWRKIRIPDQTHEYDLECSEVKNPFATCKQLVPEHKSTGAEVKIYHFPENPEAAKGTGPRGTFLAFSEARDQTGEDAQVESSSSARRAQEKFVECYRQRQAEFTNKKVALKLALMDTLDFVADYQSTWYIKDELPLNSPPDPELIAKIKIHLSLVTLQNDGTYTIVRIGPSPRIYRVNDKDITLVAGEGKTRDKSLGVKAKLQPEDFEIIEGKLEPSEHLIACSKDVSDKVSPEMLHYYTRISNHPYEAVQFLSTLAHVKGAKENIAIAILEQKKTAAA